MRQTFRDSFLKSTSSRPRSTRKRKSLKHEQKKTFFASIFSVFALVFFLGATDITTRVTLQNKVATLENQVGSLYNDSTANIFNTKSFVDKASKSITKVQETVVVPEDVEGLTDAGAGEIAEKVLELKHTLFFGVLGYQDEVLLLQQKLQERGFYNSINDGMFGLGTKAAVESFQTAYGLSPTGIVDAPTREALNI